MANKTTRKTQLAPVLSDISHVNTIVNQAYYHVFLGKIFNLYWLRAKPSRFTTLHQFMKYIQSNGIKLFQSSIETNYYFSSSGHNPSEPDPKKLSGPNNQLLLNWSICNKNGGLKVYHISSIDANIKKRRLLFIHDAHTRKLTPKIHLKYFYDP